MSNQSGGVPPMVGATATVDCLSPSCQNMSKEGHDTHVKSTVNGSLIDKTPFITHFHSSHARAIMGECADACLKHLGRGALSHTTMLPPNVSLAAFQHPREHALIESEKKARLRLAKLSKALWQGQSFPNQEGDQLFIRHYLETTQALPASKPILDIVDDGVEYKIESRALDERGSSYVAATQGRRASQEDVYHRSEFRLPIGAKEVAFELFCVADGHSGDGASLFIQNHIHQEVVKAVEHFCSDGFSSKNVLNAMRHVCIQLDGQFEGQAGSTLCLSLKAKEVVNGSGEFLITANVGDSKAFVATPVEVVPLTMAHSPHLASERRAVEKRGGVVVNGWEATRVNGRVAMSRAIGDHTVTDPSGRYCVLSPLPKVSVVDVHKLPSHSVLVLASDGLEHVSTSCLGAALSAQADMSLEKRAIASVAAGLESGSSDNITLLVHQLT